MRVAWTVALLTLAPLVSGAVLRALPASLPRSLATAVDVSSTCGVIWLSVPLCIAIFPQHSNLRRWNTHTHNTQYNKGDQRADTQTV